MSTIFGNPVVFLASLGSLAELDEAVRKHYAAIGVPCGDVHEVESLV
jgi:hypothetical protein